MRDVLRPGTTLGYCTNVHAGTTLEATKRNLETHALDVKSRTRPDGPMGIGLWLAASAARELVKENKVEEFRDWLGERGLEVFTINGFPYGDFHRDVVKHDVYKPDWFEESRARYTVCLARIVAELSPPGSERSISTLPIGWRGFRPTWKDKSQLCSHLLDVVIELARLHDETGCLIHLDIEPEPGCCIDRSEDFVFLIERLKKDAGILRGLTRERLDEAIHRHIGVCHDVCHAAVMFEDQREAINRYCAAGIRVGKVQVSNAVRVDLRNLSASERTDAIAQLRAFAEHRYLHQTVIGDGRKRHFFEDLPAALEEFARTDRAGDEWRIHFHVPVFLESFGLLGTTRERIAECFDLLRDEVNHWEIETYAWNVLPEELRKESLAAGIAREIAWFADLARSTSSGAEGPSA